MTQFLRKNAKKLLIVLATILLIILIGICINKLMMKVLYKKEYSELVSKYSEQYGVDENLIYALIKAESNFEINASSIKGAKGLMQLIDSTAEDVAKKVGIKLADNDILEPEININLGTKYLAILLEKYECIEVALAAYNAGSGNVDTWIGRGTIKSDGSDIENIPFKETNNYVRKIMRDYKIYNEM